MSRRHLFAICFVSVFRFRHALVPVTKAGSFSPLLKPSLSHTLASRQGGVDRIVNARTTITRPLVVSFMAFTIVSSTATTKKQLLAWRLNKSPCNSVNSTYALILLWQIPSVPSIRAKHHLYSYFCRENWRDNFLLLFRLRVFSRALGSVARREPARTPCPSLGPVRGLWHVLWGFKVARPLGEAFRARRAIQVPANPRTG